jgi:ribosomal-protein-alanine acetyltransferase
MTHVLRRPTETDLPVLADLERELLPDEAWSIDQLREEISSDRRYGVVAVEDDAIVGYALTVRSDDVVDLTRIAVAKDHQGRGISWSLLDNVQREARMDGASRMMLEVSTANTAARALYAKAGFVQIDRRPSYYRDGSDALVLRISLGTAACGARGTWGGDG